MRIVKMPAEPRLPLSEWVVLCLVCERPTHGYAVSALLASGSELGQIWHVPKAQVYRAMDRLEQFGYTIVIGEESSHHGPVKSLSEATTAGRRAAEAWLDRPVAHPREVRSELLIKLALLDRIGADASDLLTRQHAQLAPVAAALSNRLDGTSGFQHTLALWRSESISATLRFLQIAGQPQGAQAEPGTGLR
jgi:DNA-binding PadR family transcriptional regulator